jgi:hypothetical protein
MKLPLPLGMGPTWNTFGMRSVLVAAVSKQQKRSLNKPQDAGFDSTFEIMVELLHKCHGAVK